MMMGRGDLGSGLMGGGFVEVLNTVFKTCKWQIKGVENF
jgi:hypothetical protein